MKNQSTVDIKLVEDTQNLDEVVVVGYGVQKKVNLTGAVAQVTAKELENRPVSNATQILQGTMPNVNITFSTENRVREVLLMFVDRHQLMEANHWS